MNASNAHHYQTNNVAHENSIREVFIRDRRRALPVILISVYEDTKNKRWTQAKAPLVMPALEKINFSTRINHSLCRHTSYCSTMSCNLIHIDLTSQERATSANLDRSTAKYLSLQFACRVLSPLESLTPFCHWVVTKRSSNSTCLNQSHIDLR